MGDLGGGTGGRRSTTQSPRHPQHIRWLVMRAAVIKDGEIVVEERADPVPGPGELLVRVEAAGLNNADLLQKAGFYPAPSGVPADIPGIELAGVVESVGAEVDAFRAGDRVMGIVGGGAQAELALLPAPVAVRVLEGMGWPEAGGYAEAFTTAHDALVTQCHVAAGERVLVNGAAGGVGLAGVQIAAARGAEVVASVRSAALRPSVANFGCTAVAPEDAMAHGPFDVVLELVGGPNLAGDLEGLAPKGRIAVIGVGGGARTEIDLRALMGRRAFISGSTLRARSLEEKGQAVTVAAAEVMPLVEAGRVKVPIEATFAA